jgi:dolichol-phosphate mannosyltransferase
LQSRAGNLYSQLFLGNKIHDYTGGFNLYSSKLLGKVELDLLNTSGYGFLIELKYLASKHSRLVSEIPIIFIDRQNGDSKIPKDTILKNLLLVPRLRFRFKR